MTNSESKETKQKLKCSVCNRKIKIIEQLICKCRCGLVFCEKHRHADTNPDPNNNHLENSHLCEFNYIEDSKKILTLQNNKIVSDKINKI
jgi:hypothetical protein